MAHVPDDRARVAATNASITELVRQALAAKARAGGQSTLIAVDADLILGVVARMRAAERPAPRRPTAP